MLLGYEGRLDMLFSSTRCFKLWDYNVSHKQLLLRSPATPEVPGNVDLVLWRVEYLAIPTVLRGITIAEPTDVDRRAVEQAIGSELSVPLFCVETAGHRHFITAGGFKVLNNDLDICNSTLVDFAVDQPAEWYGIVIAHS